MKRTSISYEKIKMLAPLTRAYLGEDEGVKHLFGFEPSFDNVAKIIDQRNGLIETNRAVLHEVLTTQYGSLKVDKKVVENINSLKDPTTFTVTTGHQLNLFTGPLYFVYKIISVIKSAKELNNRYPKNHFVPVYWMATEDHDFEEINHTWVNGRKLVWESNQKGMVGEFSTQGMERVISDLKSALGDDISSDELIDLVNKAYIEHATLADATRFLVNKWFGNSGLVIIDGNSVGLKRIFSSVVKDELLHSSSFKKVTETIQTFSDTYSPQVSPREINLFYVISGLRERIVKEGDGYTILNTEITFSESQILKELDNHPERFSPNVILRPLYQELILPNVMYYGGGAEVAYWLELKSTFEYHTISYPLVQLRNAFLILDGNAVKKVLHCCLSVEELFLPEQEQLKIILKGDNPFLDKMVRHKEDVDVKIKELISELEEFDPALITSLKSTKAGILRQLKQLDRKIGQSVKRKNQVKINRLEYIRNTIFPDGVFQERRVNVLQFIQKYGLHFFDVIEDESDPFVKELGVLYGGDWFC